jgi:hypothetical protein
VPVTALLSAIEKKPNGYDLDYRISIIGID